MLTEVYPGVPLMMVGRELAEDCRDCAILTNSEWEGVNDSLDVVLEILRKLVWR